MVKRLLRNGAAGRAFISGRQLESPKRKRFSRLHSQWGCSSMTFHIQICHSNGISATFKTARMASRTAEIFIDGSHLLFTFSAVFEEDCIGYQYERDS